MRIMQINAVSAILSTGRTTKELALALQARGHETSVVYSEGTLDYSEGYHMDNAIDKKIHALCSRITGLVGYFSYRETKKLLRYVSEWKPDIVRLGNLHGNFINIPLLLDFLYQQNIAVVVTLDDCFWFTGKCCHYTITKCYRWKEKCGKCPRLYRDNRSWFFDQTSKMLEDKRKKFGLIKKLAVVGVSKWITEQVCQSIFSCSKYIKKVYNWIDIDMFKPTLSQVRDELKLDNSFVILGVSTVWATDKGLKDFIELSQYLKDDEKIVLVGDMAREIKLPSNIISIPRTDTVEKLVEYYSMSDVFVNPSVEETFGKVTAEAMACGTPVIVYNTTACPELVTEACGKIVELHNVLQMRHAIDEIKHNGKQFYSQMCRNHAVDNFEKEKCIQEYIDIFESLE